MRAVIVFVSLAGGILGLILVAMYYDRDYGFLSGGETLHAWKCPHCEREIRETGTPSRRCPRCDGELPAVYWQPNPSYGDWLKDNDPKLYETWKKNQDAKRGTPAK